ncbi:membrane protein insertase YidC [Aquirufa regiilacus]|uniref:Membrane protein insertase YidC n=1 Tax=Aquirufa regiilacus TaxID=3024868 RepID=A0ABU3TQU9_9BACT|nr:MULTISPECIES: membrane protein insertase YidC [unclassified Aquirufa]MDT8886791.1 membrane protein insertase YidC [Aquirufa sp. LEPPI-3A]MDU0808244.1 membrane protein insertase YidC [Aquirufa sp. LEOWEIH-7C]
MDKNSISGIVLIMAMLLGYQYFFAPKEPVQTNSEVVTAKQVSPAAKSTKAAALTVVADSSIQVKEQLYTLENENLRITLSNYGGKLVSVQLKNYKSYKTYTANKKDGIVLFDAQKDLFDVEIPTNGKKLVLGKLVYQALESKNQVSFTSTLPNGKNIIQTYQLPETGFELAYTIGAKAIAPELSGNEYFIHWKENVTQTEKDAQEERKATINYLLTEDEEFDYLSENPTSVTNENLSQSIQWVSFKKKYFLAGLVPQGTMFTKANLTATPNVTDTVAIKTLDAQLVAPMGDLSTGKSGFKFYFGPNDYSIVKNIAPSFGKNVKLSYDFLLPITKYIFVPLFDFLESIIFNYGLLIIVLVLIIKTALLPLTYKSYVSMAKTRILAPEIAAIKEKIGDDPARVQQETMKLYGEVGVNPLSGCIPVLATMPVLMAVFMLFPNLINLRQESFLWAEDLSTYDSILNLPFNIPFYGSHISLFCLLMTVSQLAYGYYNNQITPDQPGQPINMKMMAYVTPVIFMFVMNSFPAGLSFYYFISNLVTIGQQLAIRKFVNEDKIKALLDANRAKIKAGGGAKKSRFSTYLQTQLKTMEEQQKAAADQKKGKKK